MNRIVIDVCGQKAVDEHRRVHIASMNVAHVARGLVAEDLGGTLPKKGKQFLRTPMGVYRLRSGTESDNSTEVGVHDDMRVVNVNMFSESDDDAISLADLYKIHGNKLDYEAFIEDLREAFA